MERLHRLFRQGMGVALVVVFSSCCGMTAAAAEYPWVKRIDRQGVQVETRAIKGAAFSEFRGRVIIEASVEKVRQVFEDEKKMPLWFHQCVEAQLVEDYGPDEKIVYFVARLPWPVSERDAVFKLFRSVDISTGRRVYTLKGLPRRLPEHAGRIRVPYLEAQWVISPVAGGQTEVSFQQHSDPGGMIPSFMVNSLIVDIPFRTLLNLKNLVVETP